MYLRIPSKIDSSDVSPGVGESGDRLLLTGTIYAPDGITPAPGVIVYYWQTDNRGYYSPAATMQPGTERHGHIRGWVRTGITGRYHIETIRPAPYPGQDIPAHIHMLIREPGLNNEYYVDDINFDDDPLLIPFAKKHPFENRGGSGVVRLLNDGKKLVAERDLILGLHIPGHPSRMVSTVISGLNIGEPQPSFRPFHAYGQDRGSRACPVCKYGRYQGVLYFAGNHPDWNLIRSWLRMLEDASEHRNGLLKVFFILGDEIEYDPAKRTRQLVQLGEELHLRQIALTFVPSLEDRESEVHLNKLASDAADLLVVYRNGNIVDRFTGLQPTEANFRLLRASLDRTRGDFLHLPAYFLAFPGE